MPELPEVQTITQQLNSELSGLKLLAVKCFKPKICKPSEVTIKRQLEGARLRKVGRVGKMIVFDFGKDVLVIHLRLTGRLFLLNHKAPRTRWERARFDFENDRSLRFDNMRMFGFAKLTTPEGLQEMKKKLGPDALEISLSDFSQRLKHRRTSIKKVLLDQKTISGLGNIYANEALFRANIHPERLVESPTAKDIRRLFSAIREVLKKGIAAGGATLSDEMYRDIYNKRGHYEDYVLVYNKAGSACPNQCGGKVQKIQLGGRGTYFCPKCQR